MNKPEQAYLPRAIGIGPNGVRVINTGFIHQNMRLEEDVVKLAVDHFCEDIAPPPMVYFEQFMPPRHIFPIKKESMSHHLRDHSAHVLILSYIYMRKLQTLGVIELTKDDVESVLWAAVYHDAMRSNDAQDDEHGERVAQFIEADKTGLTNIPDHLKPTVCTIIREHVPDDSVNMHPLSAIFKDVDNLLWIRTGDFDHHYIRQEVAHDLPPIAHALLMQTSEESKNYKDPFMAGLAAARTIGVLPM